MEKRHARDLETEVRIKTFWRWVFISHAIVAERNQNIDYFAETRNLAAKRGTKHSTKQTQTTNTFKIGSEHSNATSLRLGSQSCDWSNWLKRVSAYQTSIPNREIFTHSYFWTILSNCLSLSLLFSPHTQQRLAVTCYHGQITNLWKLPVVCSNSHGCHVAASIPVVTLHFNLPHIPPVCQTLRGRKRNSRMMKTRVQHTHEFHGVYFLSKSTITKFKINKTQQFKGILRMCIKCGRFLRGIKQTGSVWGWVLRKILGPRAQQVVTE